MSSGGREFFIEKIDEEEEESAPAMVFRLRGRA